MTSNNQTRYLTGSEAGLADGRFVTLEQVKRDTGQWTWSSPKTSTKYATAFLTKREFALSNSSNDLPPPAHS